MANRTLSDLPTTTAPDGADILHNRQSLTDKSISMSLLSEFALLNSDNSPVVVPISGNHTISTTPRKQLIIADISSTATLTFPGTYSEGYEIIIQNLSSSTANVDGLPSGDEVYPGQEIVFIWDGSAFVKRSFINSTITGTSAPSITPDFIGQKFINTSSEVVYVAVGTSSSADWKDVINVLESINQITDSNYTILDDDGYTIIEITKTTAAGTSTITLPTASDNEGRKITIKLIQNSTGFSDYVIIDGEGAETIDGETVFHMNGNNDFLTVYSNGTEWKKVGDRASYELAFTPRTDWTNVQPGSNVTLNVDSNITHNLNTPLKNLEIEFVISTDGTDNNSWVFKTFSQANSTPAGFTVNQVDNDNCILYTGAEGIRYVPGLGDGLLNNENYQYKLRVRRVL